MRGTAGKLLAAILLTLCVGVQLLEVSGRWDQRLQDTNDEAALVAAVLCIGMAVSVAGTLLTRTHLSRARSRFAIRRNPAVPQANARVVRSVFSDRPPALLRI